MLLKSYTKFIVLFLLAITSVTVEAWEGMAMPGLHIEGRYLKDAHGNNVVLHGFAQTYSPWFNERGTYWSNYDVDGCLKYNKAKIDGIMNAGWKMNFIRLHMDPYWSNTPGVSTTGENDISAFDFERFKTYLDEVFIPMTEYAVSKGMYVVMRPPGVCPEKIAVGDNYHQYLITVWSYVAQHPKLKNNPNVMFELANEPVTILGTDGIYSSNSQASFDNLKIYFQEIVDTIRASAGNILWIPGLGWQAKYKGYAVNPIVGENIGYAVHVYPGWFGSQDGGNTSTINGYEGFKAAWDDEIKPVSDFAPIIVTEMDWADAAYNASWGKAYTGTAGGTGFGANFKKIMDETGNVSWLLFTGSEHLAAFDSSNVASPGNTTFLNDPEACPWPCFHWYRDYAKENFPRPDFTCLSKSDNGNGTYTNPVIFGDFPDPDVIRVGDVYYMSTTTMHHFPGATILKSHDLVNWEYCNNPLAKIESTDCYNLDGCDRYSRGQWASSLKYHNGTFYLHFNTLDEGSYLLTATDPEGTWTKRKLPSSFYDAGLFFDDDDKIYIVYGINNLHISQLDADFNVVKDQTITYGTIESGIDNTGTEGSHLYKINGYYYIYATTGGYYKTQVAYRSSSIFGPYDEKVVFNSEGIHQGALIQTQTGEWWTMLFDDDGAYGRLPNLQPVTWVNSWPMVGVDGNAVKTYKKPNVGREYARTSLPTNDVFRDYNLAPQWEWNHNPDNSKWSLVKNAGYLRLYTAGVTDSLHKAKNTLTQRILGFPSNDNLSYGTVKMNIGNMLEGDVAGLAVFQDPYAFIGIKVINGQKKLYMASSNGTTQTGATIADSVVYLRSIINYQTSKADFYYSTNNETYIPFGSSLSMQYQLSIFVGNRFSLFNYATQSMGGYVDVDWFSTERYFKEETFFDGSFVGYSEESLTISSLTTEKTEIDLLTGSSKSYSIIATYLDGHTEDVTLSATYTNSNPEVLTVRNGQFVAKSNGEAIVTVTYKGGMGEAKSITLHISSSYFPLTNDLFNPSIYAAGTFDESTGTLITGQYGFGGWEYNSGLDLSAYKYLVAKLSKTSSGGASFRVFDESSYWSTPLSSDFGSAKQVVINLQDSYKPGTTTKFDPSHIYIVGIWSMGGSAIAISDVYVTNNDNYSKPSDTDAVITASASPTDGGTVKGAGSYSAGSSCTLTATEAAGYSFSGWTENGIVVSVNAQYNFTVTASRNLVANFVPNNTNYRVKATDCTCRGTNDGAISIALGLSYNYSINVTGADYAKTGNASSNYSLTGLAAGTYNIRIEASELPGLQQNFSVVISQPDELSVQKINTEKSVAVYSLTGGENYYVTINDQTFVSPSDTVQVSLQRGENIINIRADKLCQGEFSEKINFKGDDKIAVSPNPTNGLITISVPGDDDVVVIEITTMNGNTQYKQIMSVQPDRTVRVDASGLAAGIYIVKVNGRVICDTVKMLKR